MKHDITLYGTGFTRSARCHWTLLELGLEFENIDDSSLIGSDELRRIHPDAKVPALVIDGEPLFESAAICTYLCDITPEKNLVAKSGTRERALHEQWVSFAQSEIEGYLWSNAKHTAFYPEAKRVAAIVAPNNTEIARGLKVIENSLTNQDYILGSDFTVTDIIIGWALNWARRMGHLDELPNVSRYVKTLLAREHCTFNPE